MRRLCLVLGIAVCLAASLGCKEKMTEEERAIEAGKAMAKALIEELGKLAEESPQAKRGKVISNMHSLQLALEDFSTMAEGAYPVGPKITTGQVIATLGYSPLPSQIQTVDLLLKNFENFENPYRSDLPAMSIVRTDPPRWSIELLGQAIWVPIEGDSIKATKYKIYGAVGGGLLELVLSTAQ